MEQVQQWWAAHYDDNLIKILSSVLLILLLWSVKMMLNRTITTRVKDIRSRYIWRQSLTYAFSAIGLIFIVRLWVEWFQSVITLLGVVAAALTITSKEIILNFFSYWVIIWRGLFDIGDRIEINGVSGDVTQVGLFFITVAEIRGWVGGDDPSGRLVKVPNSAVLTNSVYNYTRGLDLVWNEIVIEIPRDEHWRKLRDLCFEVCRETHIPLTSRDLSELVKRKEEILFAKHDPVVFMAFMGDKLRITMRYTCKFHKRRTSENQITEKLLDRLANMPEVGFFQIKEPPAKPEAEKGKGSAATKGKPKAKPAPVARGGLAEQRDPPNN